MAGSDTGSPAYQFIKIHLNTGLAYKTKLHFFHERTISGRKNIVVKHHPRVTVVVLRYRGICIR